MKIIQVIGGGPNQLGLVNAAKRMGYQALVTDVNENPPARAISDFYERIDTRDASSNLEAAIKHDICAVVTDQTDVAVPTVAYVAESMGLPGIGYDLALKFTNKYVMRSHLAGAFKSSIPAYHFFKSPADAETFLVDAGARRDEWIIKPHTSQGSKGVARLGTDDDAGLIWDAYIEANYNGILVEEFIPGEEYSVEAFVCDGEVHNVAVTKKMHYSTNQCLDYRNTYLGDVDAGIESDLYQLNAKIIRHLGLPFGATHAEYMVQESGSIYLMEIAARGGGGNISAKIVPYLTNFNPTESILMCALGMKPLLAISDYKQRYAILRFFDFEPGRVRSIDIGNIPEKWLLHFELNLKVGDTIAPLKDSRDRTGYFINIGDTPDEALEREKTINTRVSVAYD